MTTVQLIVVLINACSLTSMMFLPKGKNEMRRRLHKIPSKALYTAVFFTSVLSNAKSTLACYDDRLVWLTAVPFSQRSAHKEH